jgi:pyruvate dehydrogenase E2 component (dihydrolipoamide acetyltransferase)
MTEIVMPRLSDSMEEGTVLSWLKASGDRVEVGEELLEIETDKSTVTQVAEVAGVLEILVGEGTTVAVGRPIARVGEDEAQRSREAGSPPTAASIETASPPTASESLAAAPVSSNGAAGRRATATPLAQRVAAFHGVSLDDIEGTGPLGRITRADVLGKAGLDGEPSPLPTIDTPASTSDTPAPPSPPPVPAAAEPPVSRLGTKRQEPSRLQQVIARRMADAKATVPHFQVQTEVVMDALIALRADLKALAGESEPVPSFNDIILKASALALRDHPLANGSFKDDGFELHGAINIGMAVAADSALVVPTVFDAAGKSLGQIARETRELAARVRSGDITPQELSGATFTVSNLGMLAMTAITPVINPPQAAILGVGAMRDTLARVHGEIVDRTLLTLTLSCDHRILYGADAARFLARIRELMETPLKMAL